MHSCHQFIDVQKYNAFSFHVLCVQIVYCHQYVDKELRFFVHGELTDTRRASVLVLGNFVIFKLEYKTTKLN